MLKITKKEYEDLCIYISYSYLQTISRTDHGFLYNKKFYVLRLSEDDSINVPELDKNHRIPFIKEFATFALTCLFELQQSKENYFVYTSPKEGEYYMATVKEGCIFVKKISEKDLE